MQNQPTVDASAPATQMHRLPRSVTSTGDLSRPAVYFALLIAVLLVRAPSWPITLIDSDEYAFILSAREILRGHLPYTTFFDIKPPGSSVLLAASMALLGQGVLAIRLFGAACVLATSLCLFETVRLLTSRQREALAAALLYIAYSTLFHGLATMTEIILAPFTCAGVAMLALYASRAPSPPRAGLVMFAAGLAFGLAIWIKTVPVLPAALLGAGAVLYRLIARRASFAAIMLHGALYSGGIILPVAITIAIYAHANALPAFMYANVGFMSTYVQKPGLLIATEKIATIMVQMWPLVLAASIGAWLDLRDTPARGNISLPAAGCILWLGAEAIASIAPMQLYAHYFLMTLPPLTILAARALVRIADHIATPLRQAASFATLLAIAVLIPVLPTIWSNAVTVIGRSDEQRQAARSITEFMPPGENTLFVLSYEFMADYFLTGARLPARVAIPAHLFGPQSRLSGGTAGSTLDGILAGNPGIILLDKTTYERDVPPDARAAIEAKLACCYQEAASFPSFWFIDPGTYHIRDVRIYRQVQPQKVGEDVPSSPNPSSFRRVPTHRTHP